MRKYVWGALVLIYGVFFSWYNDFSGPLTDGEVAHYVQLMEGNGASVEMRQNMRRFLEEDDGREFIMVNFAKYNQGVLDVEGEQMTAPRALATYMSFMLPQMLRRGSMPLAMGQVRGGLLDSMGVTQDIGWDAVNLVRYSSRRVIAEISTHPGFQEYHKFKDAAVETAFAVPVGNWMLLITLQLFVPLVLLLIGVFVSNLVGKKQLKGLQDA